MPPAMPEGWPTEDELRQFAAMGVPIPGMESSGRGPNSGDGETDLERWMADFHRSMGTTLATINDARQTAEPLISSVLKRWTTLRDLLERHERTILTRWAKKSKKQRLQILSTAWPDMPAVHRPDFAAFMKEPLGQAGASKRFKFHYMMPYINQEDLCGDGALPLLLHSRGRNLPSAFAGADIEAMKFAIVARAVKPVFVNDSMMLLNYFASEESMSEYGKIVDSDDGDEDVLGLLLSQKQFHPGEGLFVLEVQARLLGFLLDCCRQILHDIPRDTWISGYEVQPEPHVPSDNKATGFDSLAVMVNEAPYRVPASLDLGKVESLLEALTSASEDRLWALREDPLFFYEELKDAKEHRLELVPDSSGQAHPVTRAPRTDIFWTRIFKNLVVEALVQPSIYSELKQQAHDLRLLQSKYAAVITPTEDLPADFMTAIVKFYYCLGKAVDGLLGILHQKAPGSPPFRHLWGRNSSPDLTSGKMSIGTKPRAVKNSGEKNVLFLISELMNPESTARTLRQVPIFVDQLEYVSLSDPNASRLISSSIAKVIGDLSILTQCIHQLELYHPWSRTYESKLEDQEAVEKEYLEIQKPWRAILEGVDLSPSLRLLDPFKTKVTYPVGKDLTEANVNALRKAEANLDAFWDSIDTAIAKSTADLSETATMRLLTQPRALQRTPEWTPSPTEATPTITTDTSVPTLHSIYEPMSRLFSTPTSDSTSERIPKTKTRGTADPTDPTEPESSTDPVDATKTIYQVDAVSLKVFGVMFFTPDVSGTPGAIAWDDFCKALTAVGFTAEQAYGSAWNFYPTALDVDRPIQFHQPHPSGKIPYAVARRHGRRLHRAYGWDRENFVLKA